jgi:hypothetical protein
MPNSLLWTPNEVSTNRLLVWDTVRKQVKQPILFTDKINFNNSLTQGLEFLATCSKDVVNNTDWYNIPNKLAWMNKYSPILAHNANNSLSPRFLATNKNQCKGSNWSLAIYTALHGHNVMEPLYAAYDSSVSGRGLIVYKWTDGSMRVDIPWISSIMSYNPTGMLDDKVFKLHIITRQGNQWYVYLDGTIVAQTTNAASHETSTYVDIGYAAADNARLTTGAIAYSAVWPNRTLSASEVLELSRNPWQLFAPPRAPMPYTERKPMVSMATTRRVPVAGVSQPLRSVRLNRSHPLFGGLALATSAENWALSDKTRTQLRADASKVDIARGLRFTSTSNNPSDVPLIKVANEKVSVVGYFYVPSATPSGNRVVFRYGHYTSGTDNSGFWLFRTTGGDTLTLGVHNNNTPTYVNLTNVLAGGGAFAFHATYDGSVAYVWVSNLATGAVNSNNTVGGQSMRAPPYGSATLVIGQYSSSSDYVSVATLAVWTGRKVEGAYEFPLWSRNPWALFEGANPSPIHYPTPDRGVKRKLYISSPSVRQPNG